MNPRQSLTVKRATRVWITIEAWFALATVGAAHAGVLSSDVRTRLTSTSKFLSTATAYAVLLIVCVLAAWSPGVVGSCIAAEPQASLIRAVAEDPHDSAILYAATSSGLFRSVDGGSSWSAVAVAAAGSDVTAVAVSPGDPLRLLAGSGLGLFASSDGGETWAKLRTPKDGVTAIAFAPGNGSLVGVGTQAKGLYVSVDGGVRFKASHSGLPRPVGRGSKSPITGIAVDPTGAGVAWIGTEVNGIYRLAGRKFLAPENGTAVRLSRRAGHVPIAVDPSAPSTVYGVIPTERNSSRIDNLLYRSADGGRTWPHVTTIAEDATLTALYFRDAEPGTLYARDRTTLLAFDVATLEWVPAPLPDPLAPRGRGVSAPTVFDNGDVTVMIDDGTLVHTATKGQGEPACDANAANDDIDFNAIARAFYGPPNQRRVQPAHEILSVFASQSWIGRIDPQCGVPIVNVAGGAGAYSQPVRNPIRGIGFPLSEPSDPGTFPQPLMRILNMNNMLHKFAECNALSALYVFGHEFGHLTMTYAHYRRANGGASSELFDTGSHWSLGVNSEASPDGGAEWADRGGGRFDVVAANYRYGPMDQYLLGLRTPAEVSNFFLLRVPNPMTDVVMVPTGVGAIGGPSGGGSSPECSPFEGGQVRNATREPIDVSQVIAVEGPRSGPDGRLVHQAFVLLVPPGQSVDPQELALLQQRRQEWSGYYHRATDGRGRMETCLRPPCGSCGDGARGGGEQCDGTDLGGATCGTFGLSGGPLTCSLACEFDLGQCHSTCGNGVREGGEFCDGADLNGVTCENNGFVGGQVRCSPTCQFDLSGCTSGTGRVQGKKIRADGSLFDSPVIRLDGGSPTTSNPFTFGSLAPGAHRVSSDVPAGSTVAFSVCVNCTGHPTPSFVSGSSVVVTVPAAGFVDVQWRYSAGTPTATRTPTPTRTPTRTPTPAAPSSLIQGIKVDAFFQAFDAPVIRVDGVSSTSANPYAFGGLTAGNHTVTTTAPAGFAASYLVCTAQQDCRTAAYTPGTSANVSVPPGGTGQVDLWWKYTATNGEPGLIQGIKVDSSFNGFDAPVMRVDGVAPTSANPYAFSGLSPGTHTVTTTVPAGFAASYLVCTAQQDCRNAVYTPGSSATVSVPPGGTGQVDLWWQYTATSGPAGLIQGIKVDAFFQGFDAPVLRVDGGSPTSANPYAFGGVSPGNHTVSTTVPPGVSVSYAVCKAPQDCRIVVYTPGTTATVSVPPGGTGQVDLWWKYTSP